MWDRGIPAERALLGAVLLDPAAQQKVLDLVEPADMLRPWHAQILEAMQRARGRGALPDAAEVYRELQNDPDLPRSVARDAVPLTGLMEAAPSARHASAYAAMVIEGGIRQRLHLAGSRMEQAAETGELEAAWQQTTRARYELDACSARWLALPAHLRQELPGKARSKAGEAARAQPPWPHRKEAVAAGATALRDLAAAPSQLADVSRWLHPEHFAWPADGSLYAVMRDMNAAGMTADPVTITWEAARRGLRAEPGNLAGGTGAFAAASAREVYRHGVLACVAQAGRDIQIGAASPAVPPGQLMRSAGDRLRTIETQPQPGAAPAWNLRVPAPGRVGSAVQPARLLGREAGRHPVPEAAGEPEREAAQ
jgi:DnaB-like helicase N terminal domain